MCLRETLKSLVTLQLRPPFTLCDNIVSCSGAEFSNPLWEKF